MCVLCRRLRPDSQRGPIRGRTTAARVLVGSWTLIVAAASLAPAATAQDAETQAHSGAFSDDDGSFAEPAFEALAARSIFDGTECGTNQICPGTPIKRSTMAVWLTRSLDYGEPAEIDSSRFADVDSGEWWAAHVERFAELEVTRGCASEPLRYCPDQSVNRAEMAAFLVRALRLPDAAARGFTDTSGNFAENNIDALAAAGITAGCSTEPLRFCPDQPVTRAQMATFLARALGLVASPSAETLSAQEVFARVSPSIAYVETRLGSGSGILIPGDYVLTNHHVVWPSVAATVVFPDGTEYVDAPVAATNPWADIAVLGPLDTDKRPLTLAAGEDLPPGSDLFLIGYPAEYEFAPEPTITRGLLSRVRHWDGYDLTLLQTDTAITGGQSGGALVDDRGRVIGVSTWRWTDANFALSTSASDDAEIVELMLASDDYEFSFADRVDESSSRSQSFELQGVPDSATFVAFQPDGADIELELQGGAGAGLWAADLGPLVAVGDDGSLPRQATLDTFAAFVEVVNLEGSDSYTLESNADLFPYFDEDGTVLLAEDETGHGFAGVFDYYQDADWYSLELLHGETVRIWTESVAADTFLRLYDDESYVVTVDDDSGPLNIFGEAGNSEIVYTAPSSGTYFVQVDYLPELGFSDSYIINAEILE